MSGRERIAVSEEHWLDEPSAQEILDLIGRFLANPAIDPTTFSCGFYPCTTFGRDLLPQRQTHVLLEATTYERHITPAGETTKSEESEL